MNQIREDHLWDYAEGRLPEAEKAAVEQWLAADPVHRRQLEEVRKLSGCLGSMEADMPSMRFTAGIMEIWDSELAIRATPLKTHTDKRIVLGVAALLALALAGVSGLLFSLLSAGNMDLPAEKITGASRLLGNIFSGLDYYFAGLIVILTLALAERYLHYRNYIRSSR